MFKWPEWKRNLIVMWFAQLIVMGAITGVVSFLPLYIPQLGIDNEQSVKFWSGILMGAAPLFAGVASPYWGAVADRSGRKPMVERVMLMFGIVMIGMAFVTDVYQLLALRVLQGIFGGFTAAALALVTSVTPPEEIGFTMGMFQTAMITGGATGPMLGGLVADHFGFDWAFMMFGLLCLVSMLIVRFALTERFVPAAVATRPSMRAGIKEILALPGLKTMLVVQFLVQFSIQVIAPVLPLYIQAMVPGSIYVASICGTVIAVAGLTSALASASIGWISRLFSNRAILIVAAAVGAVIFGLQALAGSVLMLSVLRGLSGLCLGLMLPTSNTIISCLIPADRRGVAYGVTTGAAQLGNVLGPVSGGALALSLGNTSAFWLTALLFATVSVWVAVKVKEPQVNH